MDTRMVPRPVTVGPEMEALGRFYPDVTWKGIIHAGGMGPGTPAMTGVGRSQSQLIQGGRWIATDSEQDQFLEDGTFVLTWQLHAASRSCPRPGSASIAWAVCALVLGQAVGVAAPGQLAGRQALAMQPGQDRRHDAVGQVSYFCHPARLRWGTQFDADASALALTHRLQMRGCDTG
jgi:hypothetical protein